MNNNLKERYIYAVVRHLPKKMQADVEQELETLISDMIEERFSNATPSEENVKSVLAELGNPDDLAVKYLGDEGKALISGIYFVNYKRILLFVLPLLAAIVFGANFLSGIFIVGANPSPGRILNLLVTQPIGSVVQMAISAFALITVIFVIAERKKADWFSHTLDELPEVPGKNEKIGLGTPIAELIVVAIGMAAFVWFPQIIGGYFADAGGWIPVFNIEVLHSLWIPLTIGAAFCVGWAIMSLVEGRYSIRIVAATAVTNVVVAICAGIVLFNPNLINPAFVEEISILVNDYAAARIFENLNLYVFGIILIVLIAETASVVWKAVRGRR